MIVDKILGNDIKTFVEAHRLPLGYQANRIDINRKIDI